MLKGLGSCQEGYETPSEIRQSEDNHHQETCGLDAVHTTSPISLNASLSVTYTDKETAEIILDVSKGAFCRIAAKLGCNIAECAERIIGKHVISTGELLFALMIIHEPGRAFPSKFSVQLALAEAADAMICKLALAMKREPASSDLIEAVEKYLALLSRWEASELLEEINHTRLLVKMYESNSKMFNGNGLQACRNRIARLEERFASIDLVHKSEALLESVTILENRKQPCKLDLAHLSTVPHDADDGQIASNYNEQIKMLIELHATQCMLSKYNGVDRRVLLAIEAAITMMTLREIPADQEEQMRKDLAANGVRFNDVNISCML